MTSGANRLTARSVATLKKPGRHSDGNNLYLSVSKTGAKSWTFLWRAHGRPREMGLGSAAHISLKEARDRAKDARAHIVAGRDPIEARNAGKQAESGRKSFGECADALIAAKESGWRNEKHRQQWRMTLETYAKPLWPTPVDEVDTRAVLAVLMPLWQAKAETASRLRGRIESVLDYAKAHGLRSGENPAAWRGHLSHLLLKRGKLTRGHHPAMPYPQVPAFLAQLRESESMAGLALEFTVLTAARSGEVLGARWDEIDTTAKVWTIPAARMKAAKEHRVPLSDRALAIIEKLAEARTSDFVFSGQRRGRPLSGMSMAMLLKRMKVKGVTVHGFRSSFRDWAGDATSFQRETVESALAHIAGDATERAYRRSDALEKRRELMAAWSRYCDGSIHENVIALSTGRA